MRSALDSLAVLAGARVDAHPLALVDEQGDLQVRSRADGRVLQRARLGIALDARFAIRDFQFDERRQLDGNRFFIVQQDVDLDIFGQPTGGIADLFPHQGDLLVRLRVHEGQIIAVRIEKLHLALFEAASVDALAGAVGAFENQAGDHALHLATSEGIALSGLDELGFDDDEGFSFDFDLQALAQITRLIHEAPRARNGAGPSKTSVSDLTAAHYSFRCAPRLSRGTLCPMRHSTRLRYEASSRAVGPKRAAERLGLPVGEHFHAAAGRLPFRLPEGYLELIDPADAADPLLAVAWPHPEELRNDANAIEDPVGDRASRPHPLIVRKHADRAILLVTSRCHLYCRYCFRAGEQADRPERIREAIDRLASERDLREVILSGGDPLVLPDDDLVEILRSLAEIPHLETVRIHTRAAAADPRRITPRLAKALADAAPAPLWIVIHTVHSREITPDFLAGCEHFRQAGLPLLNQSVLLRGVNDEIGLLAELFRKLYARQIKPYYLHHPDRVRGTARFRLPLEQGLALYRGLRERIPGPALPLYVLDLPDGSGKVAVEAMERTGERAWRYVRSDGSVSTYADIEL